MSGGLKFKLVIFHYFLITYSSLGLFFPKCITLHFAPFKLIDQVSYHSTVLFIPRCSPFSSPHLLTAITLLISAYILQTFSRHSGRSLYTTNINGPNTEPFETELVTSSQLDSNSPRTTHCCLPFKKASIQFNLFP